MAHLRCWDAVEHGDAENCTFAYWLLLAVVPGIGTVLFFIGKMGEYSGSGYTGDNAFMGTAQSLERGTSQSGM